MTTDEASSEAPFFQHILIYVKVKQINFENKWAPLHQVIVHWSIISGGKTK
jgi:hypothetical protein